MDFAGFPPHTALSFRLGQKFPAGFTPEGFRLGQQVPAGFTPQAFRIWIEGLGFHVYGFVFRRIYSSGCCLRHKIPAGFAPEGFRVGQNILAGFTPQGPSRVFVLGKRFLLDSRLRVFVLGITDPN